MILASVVLIISIIIACQWIPKLKQQQALNTMIAFSLLLLIGTVLNMGIFLKIKIPSPFDGITFILSPLKEYIVSFTK